jgi:uncharacterized damage-inducible protein DinB
MSTPMLQAQWDHFRDIHGVFMRLLAAFPKDKLDAHVIPGMRTPKELAVHAYAYVGGIPAAVVKGNLTAEDAPEPADKIKSTEELLRHCRERFALGEKNVAQITDAHLNAMVTTHWGPTMPGVAMMGVIHDETLHHRGQLYAMLRACGVEPPFMWGFDQNLPEDKKK